MNAPASHQPAPPRDPDDVPVPGDGVTRYVLPLVVRLERNEPPARTDALETAARAVLAFLTDERSTGGAAEGAGQWAEVIGLWEARGIRKVVRRARGAEWRRVQELPGITVSGRTAEVRVFPPIPLDGWPKELSKLQVSGTELDDPEPPAAPGEGVPLLWLSPHLEMSAGKAMAQAAHGAQLAWWDLDDTARAAWAEAGFPLAVRAAAGEQAWKALESSGLPAVRDAGFTEIAPGSCTVIADHPALRRTATED